MSVRAIEIDGDFYGSFGDYLEKIYGIDENAGLTSFPILNVPSGGRAEGMAGAFSAVCDDVSFLEWNPAGSANLSNGQIAFFHNNWVADTKIETTLYSTKIKNFGIGVLGKWLYTPFTEYDDWGTRASKGYYSEILGIANISYTFFKGYYFSGLSVGVNLKGVGRVSPDMREYSSESQSAGAFAADVGLLTHFSFLKFYKSREKNLSLALTLRNLGAPVKVENFDSEPLPSAAVAGLSYKPLRPVLIAFDFTYPMNFEDISLSEKPSFALGISAAVTRFLDLRAGFLIQSGSSRITIGSGVKIGRVAFDINYSLDLLTQFQNLNRVTIGMKLNFGDDNLSEKRELADRYYLDGLDAYAAGKDDQAREFFIKALEFDPYFDPAKEALRAIDEYRRIESRIEDMEQLHY